MGITKTDLFTEEQNALATMAKALAHPARIAILQHLLNTNACINSDLVGELGLELSSPMVFGVPPVTTIADDISVKAPIARS